LISFCLFEQTGLEAFLVLTGLLATFFFFGFETTFLLYLSKPAFEKYRDPFSNF